MKICFVVPDGVGVKNYLYTDLITQLLAQRHEVVLLHALAPEVMSEIKTIHKGTFITEEYKVFKEPLIARFFREACSLARLKYFSMIENNPTIKLNWMPKKDSMGKKLFFMAIEKYAQRLDRIEKIEALEDWVFGLLDKHVGTRHYEQIFQKLNPDLIFCTHQRVPEAAFPILAAKRSEIQTVTAIFSWDNLPKARLNIRCDRYLLWSDYMKKEMQRFYPTITPDSLIVSGTPQFDFYSKESLVIPRDEFASRFGLDKNKDWICFSGDDHVTSPYDPVYLEDMAKNLLEKSPDVQILFREVPTENVARYQQTLDTFSNVKHIPPIWEKHKQWNRSWPKYDDFSMMCSLAHHCVGIVNVGSTMAHDFSVNGKGCLFINYDVPNHGKWTVKDIYQFQHFRSMKGLDGVGWVNSKLDWSTKVNLIIHQPDQIAKDRQQWYQRVNEFESLGGMPQYLNKLLDF